MFFFYAHCCLFEDVLSSPQLWWYFQENSGNTVTIQLLQHLQHNPFLSTCTLMSIWNLTVGHLREHPSYRLLIFKVWELQRPWTTLLSTGPKAVVLLRGNCVKRCAALNCDRLLKTRCIVDPCLVLIPLLIKVQSFILWNKRALFWTWWSKTE